MGVGSSDAAFLLKSLNERFAFGLNNVQLEELAGRIGSDCPFFIKNNPCLVTGRGENLENIHLSLKGYYMVLICPGIQVSTAAAYSEIIPSQRSPGLREMVQHDIYKWRDQIKNQFEVPVFRKHPLLKVIKEELYSIGAEYASMTGSGSAIFGLFRSVPEIPGQFKDYFIFREWLS